MKCIDLTGQRFGRLEAVSIANDLPRGSGYHVRWLCKCDCGNQKIVSGQSLREGDVRSCGCITKERLRKHNKTGTRLYNVWCAIKRRCLSKTDKLYPLYGGRGITLCEEWQDDFTSFETWALSNGYDLKAKRGKCTVDRIDNDKGYFPENCRIVDMKVQGLNKRNTVRFEYFGQLFRYDELSNLLNIPIATIQDRHYNKKPPLKEKEIERLKQILKT